MTRSPSPSQTSDVSSPSDCVRFLTCVSIPGSWGKRALAIAALLRRRRQLPPCASAIKSESAFGDAGYQDNALALSLGGSRTSSCCSPSVFVLLLDERIIPICPLRGLDALAGCRQDRHFPDHGSLPA